MSKKEPLKTVITAEWNGEASLDPIAMRAIHTVLKSNSLILKNVQELIKSNHNQLITIQSITDINFRVMAALIPDTHNHDDYIDESDSTDEDGV